MKKFPSELQQRNQNEELFERLLKCEVSVPLGAIIGSMFELNKCFQTATKIHQVPVNQSTNVHELERVMDDNSDYGPACEIHSLETQTFSEDNNTLKEWDIEDEAEKCYQKPLDSEYLCEYGLQTSIVSNVHHTWKWSPPRFKVQFSLTLQSVHR